MDETLLTPAEVAERLKVSKPRVYQMVKEGDIPAVRFGKSVRVRPEDLDRFINEKAGVDRHGRVEDGEDAGE